VPHQESNQTGSPNHGRPCLKRFLERGDVKRNTSPSGDNPDTTMWSGQPAQLGLCEPMMPAVDELQWLNAVVRNWSANGRLRPTIDLSEPRGLTLCRVMRGGI